MTEVERNLDTLAKRINEEHRRCEAAVTSALEHALAAGDLLIEAKSACPHGAWQTWLEGNFAGSVRTAQAYMRVAARRDEIEAAKTQSSAPLSLDGALRILAEPRAALPSTALERYPFLENFSDNPAHIERAARRLDEMSESRRRGFSREFAITACGYLNLVVGWNVDKLLESARDDYGLELSPDFPQTWAVISRLYSEKWARIMERLSELVEREAELDRLEGEVTPADVPPGREHEALVSMLSGEDMLVPLAELRRMGKLEESARFDDWYEHAYLSMDVAKG